MTVTAIGLRAGLGLGLVLGTATACVPTAAVPAKTTAVAPTKTAPVTSAKPAHVRAGSVESVREVVHGGAAKTVGDALVSMLVISAVLGALVFDVQGPERFGLATAVAGNDRGPGSTVSRVYDVAVRFDDGGSRTFAFEESSPPFRAGDRVVLSANDLVAASD